MITPTLDLEKKLWNLGYSIVCGLDEVGRGCFAGPVVAGAVIFPSDINLPQGIADSKLLKPETREKLSKEIKQVALYWSVGEVGVEDIDQRGIGDATQRAFGKAVENLPVNPDMCLIDAFYIKYLNKARQRAIKGGDTICASISAASIIAKVYRDGLMIDLDKQFPGYDFGKHKGYGTKQHQEAIKKYGLTKIHRKSFNLQKFI